MSRAETIRAFLNDHWTVPGELLVAAEELWEPDGPEPELFETLSELLSGIAADAQNAGLPGVDGVAQNLAALVGGLGTGELDPLGPAGGLLEAAARALEEAFILLEAGEEPDDEELRAHTERVAMAAGKSSSAPSSPEPAIEPTLSAEISGSPQPPHPGPLPAGEGAPAVGAVSAAGGEVEARTFAVEKWGPWEPAYADLEDDYLEEVQGSIDTLQAGLITLASGQQDEELINDLFRSSHSIKGQSGQMGVQPLEKVAHKLEDVLDLVRRGELVLSPSSTEALLGVIDALQEILEQLRSTRHIEHPLGREIALMEQVSRGEPSAAQVAEPPPSDAVALAVDSPTAAQEAQQKEPSRPKSAPRPGQVQPSTPKKAALGKAKAQYLRVDFSKVDDVMNLVGDLFINKIKLHDGVSALDELHLQVMRLQTVLSQRLETSSQGISLDEEESKRIIGGIAGLATELESLSDKLTAATGETDMISSELRDQVMVMRMVPLDSVFGRLGRVVFDAVQKESRGHEPGWKQARLDVVGADAEIDKVIANTLEVPLVHIVRNAVAHGIEPASERVEAGKPPDGTVHVKAGQRGSQFVIECTDDGRGMIPDVIGQVALEKGLLDEEELDTMSEKEILGLIFKPGFTTAKTADDLKGRGVGLDEVMSKVSQIKGSIEVESEIGRGSKVTLSLPLTLAINTVLIGEVAGETLAVPMSVVERVVTVTEAEVEHMGETQVFSLHGQTVPLVRADDLLSMGRPPAQRPDSCYVVVMNVADRRFGLALDKMKGKQDVVVKSLGTLIVEAPLVAGSTLLGEQCILILDPVDIAANLGKGRLAGARGGRTRREQIRPRLLLVEDETSTRIGLKRIYEDAGLEVHEAADGVEALEAAGRISFQIVSTDIIMPRMDGYELTRRLRQNPAYQDVPILMISSKAEDVDKRAGFEAGVDYYMVKPVERSELLELIEKVRL